MYNCQTLFENTRTLKAGEIEQLKTRVEDIAALSSQENAAELNTYMSQVYVKWTDRFNGIEDYCKKFQAAKENYALFSGQFIEWSLH